MEAPKTSNLRECPAGLRCNLARRRLREIIRESELQDGIWVVTIARWRVLEASFEELKQDWMRAARRARILQKEAAVPGTP